MAATRDISEDAFPDDDKACYYRRSVQLRNGRATEGDMIYLISERDYTTYADAHGPGWLIYVDPYDKGDETEVHVVWHHVAGLTAHVNKVKAKEIELWAMASYERIA